MERLQRNRIDADFKKAPITSVRLSSLIRTFESGNALESIALLRSRKRLHIDSKFMVNGNDPRIVWRAQASGAYDFLCCVPNRPGFLAVLPFPPTGTSFEYAMDFTKLHKEFKAKHAHLNFDPAHRMLFIGRFANQDLWGTWIPNEWFTQADDNAFKTGYTSGDTRMHGDIARWTILFLAFVMHQKGISDVTCSHAHPKVLDSYSALRRYTNLV